MVSTYKKLMYEKIETSRVVSLWLVDGVSINRDRYPKNTICHFGWRTLVKRSEETPTRNILSDGVIIVHILAE